MQIRIPKWLQKLLLGGAVVFVPTAIGIGMNIVNTNVFGTLEWFTASASSAVIAVF
jgi:hypothetical protein